jgi:hypothetical protein
MWYSDDSMLTELRQIKVKLWEKSGHDLHNMAKTMKQETNEIMFRYGKISQSKEASKTGMNADKSA